MICVVLCAPSPEKLSYRFATWSETERSFHKILTSLTE